jgi:hypothetical protein
MGFPSHQMVLEPAVLSLSVRVESALLPVEFLV